MFLMSPAVKGSTTPRRTRRDQARETRVRIMRAAVEVFGQKGYTGARMTDIAAAAGVAVQTVYFAFHTKPELVQACYEHAVLGPENLPPPQQSWHARVRNARSGRAALAAFADGCTEILERAALIDDIARSALHEPEVAAVRERSEDLRRRGYEELVTDVAERFGLRRGLAPERAVDLALALAGPQTYLQLRSYGWTSQEYAAWLTATLHQQLLPGGRTR